jgi:hypothetical protein
MCLLHNVTNAIVIYNIAMENQSLKDNHIAVYNTELTSSFEITLIVMTVLNTLALLFLTQLIIFHVELKFRGLTTYEFLKLKENSSKESKIVVRVNQDMQEAEDKKKIIIEQAKLRKKLEMVA